MTQLRVQVNQPYASGYMEAGAMITVRRLSDAQGRMSKWWTDRKPVDVAGDKPGPRGEAVFDLPGGGRYGVTVTRPRATGSERELVVNEGEQRRETLVLEGSPHEYLGWQQFAGIVGPVVLREKIIGNIIAPPQPELFAVALSKGRDAWGLKIESPDALASPRINWEHHRDGGREEETWHPVKALRRRKSGGARGVRPQPRSWQWRPVGD